MSTEIAIGIDLGTTFSCVAVYQNKKINIITNPGGSRTTPSEVAFKGNQRLVGTGATNQASLNPKNTIFDAKRFIGRNFDDPEIQSDLKNAPFTMFSQNSKLVIEVDFQGAKKTFTPHQISAFVLQNMKETAEKYLGHKVKKAVITVPAYFNQEQRQATKEAARLAGLDVLRLINEPTAAAMAFGLEKDIPKRLNVLIFDLGGGTFDVSIVEVSPGCVFNVLSTTGDTHFGGSDFDQKILNYFTKVFNKKHGVDISKTSRSIRRLRAACESAKRSLSENIEETVVVDALFEGIDFVQKINRMKFDDLCESLYAKILDPVKNALSDAKLTKQEVDEIVLVGGSTRIPKVQKILKDFFNGKALNSSINADEAVAYGAAALAAKLSGVKFANIEKLVLQDVTPLSLGTDRKGGFMTNIITRNTPIPTEKTRTFVTSHDNQTAVSINVYEGEKKMCADNKELGKFNLEGITPLPKGKTDIDVTFKIDKDGILIVTAAERSSGKSKSIIIKKT